MMEEEKPLADVDAPPADVQPTTSMPDLSPRTQGQEDDGDARDDVRQLQPGQHPQFWSVE
jgi:3-hydroxyacyl-[acyl-carrier-protein] dehydratase